MLDELGTFVDRQTFQWERTYPHPIERVWTAVTDEKELAVWMSPGCKVELSVGAEGEFVWGVSVVSRVEPPNVFELAAPDYDAHLRFELEDLGGTATRLRLVQSFAPGAYSEPDEMLGGDQPAGPGTPWKPHFLAGFHAMLEFLRPHLDGEAVVFEPMNDVWHEGIPVYRELIRNTIPPADTP